MALLSNQIVRQSYVRIGAFQGNASEIATAYSDDAALATVNTESFPLQSMYDMLTLVEGEMASAIGLNINSVYRSVLHDVVGVTSGDVVPTVGAGAGEIIGVWGQVRDAVTGIELTPNLHLDEVRAIVNSDIFISSYYSYVYAPPRIYATVDDVEIDVTTFDQAARQTAIEANGALLFPQLEGAYFSGLMSNLKNEDPAYTALSNEYAPAYQVWLQSLNPAPRNLVGEAAA